MSPSFLKPWVTIFRVSSIKPDHADHRRRQNAAAVGLVIERNVARHDRRFEHLARLGHPVDNLRESPHHLRPLGRGKIEAVCDSDRLSTDADDIAGGLGDRELCSLRADRSRQICRCRPDTSRSHGAFL